MRDLMRPAMRGFVGRLLTALTLSLASLVAAAAERAIDKDVLIAATLDQAWAAWTTRDSVHSFFAPGAVVEPRVGSAFHTDMDPGGGPGMKGADDMRYLALQPKKMFSLDWNAPPSLPDARAQRTFVIVRFYPADGTHTRVTIHHTGWAREANGTRPTPALTAHGQWCWSICKNAWSTARATGAVG